MEQVGPYSHMPEVPTSDRPRPLYVRHNLSDQELSILRAKGWEPADVRLIRDPQASIKATLEGARIGVIQLTSEELDNLLAEAKVYGLLGTKKADENSPNEEKTIQEDDLDAILSFGSLGLKKVDEAAVSGPKKRKPRPDNAIRAKAKKE